MKEFYITFGQTHTHRLNNKTLDCDCVGIIKAEDYEKARDLAFEIFGPKFYTVYEEKPEMEYYPKGLININ